MARGFHTLAERRCVHVSWMRETGAARADPADAADGELWKSQGMKVVTNTPEQFARRMRADYEKYGRIVKTVGITPE